MTAVEQSVELVRRGAESTTDRAEALTISSNADYEAAAEFLTKTVKPMIDQVKATFDPIVRKAHEAHAEALAQRRKVLDPLQDAEGRVKGLLAEWHRKQEVARRRAEEAARIEAQKKAEEERLAQAQAMEEAGRQEIADAMMEAPVQAAPSEVDLPKKPKAEGVTVTKRWKFRIVDAKRINAPFIVPDEKKIRSLVSKLGEEAVEIVGDGIEVYAETSVSARKA